MAKDDKSLKPESMWMAYSAAGYPVPPLGVCYTRRELRERYKATYGHTLAKAGYRVSRVRIVPLSSSSAPKDPAVPSPGQEQP